MNLVERGLHKVLNLVFERRDVVVQGELYLRRWYLRDPKKPGPRVFLHFIGKSDDIHVLHDHPWTFVTLILARGYREHLPNGKVYFRKPWTLHLRNAEYVHAVAPTNGPAWTLVLADRARRVWGFHKPTFPFGIDWVDWRTYLKMPNAKDWIEDIPEPE